MKQHRILVVTTLIPSDKISRKKSENDILFVTENEIRKYYQSVKFQYVFVFSKASFILSKLKKRWEEYYKLQQLDSFKVQGKKVVPLALIQLPYDSFKLRNIFYSLSLFIERKKINKLIEEFKPTVIHAHDVNNQAYIARWISKRYKIPYVITLRSTNSFDYIVKKNLQESSHLISLSNILVTDDILRLNKSLSVIPHGLSETEYRSFSGVEQYNGTRPFKLVTVSRLLAYKNIDFVIKKLYSIKEQIDFRYYIYGDGPERENLSNLIKELSLEDRVFLKGKIAHEQVKNMLAKQDLFVLMSYPETFGRVFIETMAVGTPFIAHENTGIDGLIKKDTEGVFCNKESFVDELLRVYNNPKYFKNLRLNAYKASQRFNWEEISNKIITVYEKVSQAN